MPDALTVLPPRDALRRAIDAATRPPEADCVTALLAPATLAPPRHAAAQDLARRLIGELRATRSKAGGVDALMREFSLSSDEGVALMCLAEALLRIPDQATADALIRDKLARGNWRAHVGSSPSLFVNAAAWGLLVTGKIVATHSEEGLGSALTRLLARGGEPLIRKGVDLAMRLLGRQFVTGETIEEALERAREHEARGYRYSYDMLGEAALTDADARRYLAAYEGAIAAIGAASGGRGIVAGPGISVKLSALHPRYSLAQRERVLAELLPRLRALCLQAKSFDIGLNIDAEESERLGLSLDLVEQLLADPALAGWEGLGVVVQAYQKRCPFVIDWLLAAARRAGRRIMVRLVKGAYWDSEVKRAQVEGQADYPVFTRKVHTDVSYLACARKLLAATDVVFPQFATHNALTLAAIVQMADAARAGAWEFQCLHGMGESLYDQVVPKDKLGIPCRIYAPVGSHETLLAYLVRRLLENGANSSFVNRIVDPNVGIDELLADPVAAAQATGGTPHPRIPLPADLYAPVRRNSVGLDLNDETTLAALHASFGRQARREWRATPQLVQGTPTGEGWRESRNPARHAEVVGRVLDASPVDVEAALAAAPAGAEEWAAVPAERRAAILDAIAAALESERDALMWLAMHEAGKTLGNALGEVREAVDFCRYYAAEARAAGFDGRGAPLGVVACISPWNFPLAIFTGEVVAALAAGNAVLAKPAEQTPLIAALAVQLMHAAGVPRAALQLLPGDGRVGAQLVADARVAGVVFTGSTEVAQKIDQALAARCERTVAAGDAAQDPASAAAHDPVLIAETGGQNAMVVDSSALPEQVVTDVLASAFDSAGQRCSALRVLCLQEDIAERVLAMLHGAFAELRLGDPALLATDIGPVIDAEAQGGIEAHVAALARRRQLFTLPLAEAQRRDACFVAPAIVELGAIDELKREVFGPVLHVVRWRRSELAALVDAINATGYGLTLGIHSRIDETIDFIVARAAVGNVYVNRNVIGAVVGVQPFGGEGLSGTGPKAGGPWYLPRLRRQAPPVPPAGQAPAPLAALCQWAHARGNAVIAGLCERYASSTPLGAAVELPGPTGERNTLSWHPRGRALCLAADDHGLLAQLAAVLASGNLPVIANPPHFAALIAALPAAVRATLAEVGDWHQADVALVLHATDVPSYGAVRRHFAARAGARVRVVGPQWARSASASVPTYPLPWLLAERVVSVNTAAAGGNASLMTLGVA